MNIQKKYPFISNEMAEKINEGKSLEINGADLVKLATMFISKYNMKQYQYCEELNIANRTFSNIVSQAGFMWNYKTKSYDKKLKKREEKKEFIEPIIEEGSIFKETNYSNEETKKIVSDGLPEDKITKEELIWNKIYEDFYRELKIIKKEEQEELGELYIPDSREVFCQRVPTSITGWFSYLCQSTGLNLGKEVEKALILRAYQINLVNKGIPKKNYLLYKKNKNQIKREKKEE